MSLNISSSVVQFSGVCVCVCWRERGGGVKRSTQTELENGQQHKADCFYQGWRTLAGQDSILPHISVPGNKQEPGHVNRNRKGKTGPVRKIYTTKLRCVGLIGS